MQSMTGGTHYGYLNASAVDFHNITQAQEFLHELKHLDYLPILGSQYSRYFWYGSIVTLVVAAVINRTWSFIRAARMRDVPSDDKPSPARPKNLPSKVLATATAIGRELSYPQWTPATLSPWVQFPPLGQVYIILAYFVFILALEFINNDLPGAGYWQYLGVRAGWLAAAQIPLLVALAGKVNLISMLCDISYVRLNIYHRWVSRGLLLLSTFHFAFQNHGWNLYNISKLEWDTDDCPKQGIVAYAFILWMNLSTVSPFRYMSYEVFVIQHIVTFFGFIVMLSYHLDSSPGPGSQQYIYASAGIFLFTLLLRLCRYIYLNIRPGRVSVEVLHGEVTKLRIRSGQFRNWNPGAHLLLIVPYLGIQLSHPGTILSTPASHNGDLLLLLKARRGFTRKVFERAGSTNPLKQSNEIAESGVIPTHLALLDGPYSSSVPKLRTFDSVLLIAGGTGISFTISQLLYLAEAPENEKQPVKKIVFYWIIKEKAWLSWVEEELRISIRKLQRLGIILDIRVHITCDPHVLDDDAIQREKQNIGDKFCSCCSISQQDDPRDAGENRICCCAPIADGFEPHILTEIDLRIGRPSWNLIIEKMVLEADGEIAVAACGPVGLTQTVRRSVAKVSEELGVCKGSGLPGIFLHVESS